MENKQTKELLKLIQENPDLPVVFMVDGSVVIDPYEYRYTFVESYGASVKTIWKYQDGYYDHIVDITEAVENDLIDQYEDLDDEEFDKVVEKYIEENVEHYKAIVITL